MAAEAARRCPECGSDRIRRSHRRGPAEYALSALGWFPYRCQECRGRFRRRRGRRPGQRTSLWRVQCPRCGAENVSRISSHRVQPTWKNFWLRWVHAPAYRCPECRNHFFHPGRLGGKES